mgnify:CR=1 FL=1
MNQIRVVFGGVVMERLINSNNKSRLIVIAMKLIKRDDIMKKLLESTMV